MGAIHITRNQEVKGNKKVTRERNKVLKHKRKKDQAKISKREDTNFYNSCFKLRSRTIKILI